MRRADDPWAPPQSAGGGWYSYASHTRPAEYREIGDWISLSLKTALSRLITVAVIVAPFLLAIAATAWFSWNAFTPPGLLQSLDGILERADLQQGLTASDRQLLEDLAGALAKTAGVVAAVLLLLAPFLIGVVGYQIAHGLDGQKPTLSASLAWGKSRYGKILGTGVAYLGVAVAVLGVIGVSIFLTFTVAPLAFVLIVVSAVAGLYIQVRLSFSLALAAGSTAERPMRDSWHVTRRRWWATWGRQLLFALCLGGINFVVSLAGQIVSGTVSSFSLGAGTAIGATVGFLHTLYAQIATLASDIVLAEDVLDLDPVGDVPYVR